MRKLTPSELWALNLSAQGLTGKAIARKMGITDATVKVHKKLAFRKLGAKNTTHAVVILNYLGLLDTSFLAGQASLGTPNGPTQSTRLGLVQHPSD